MSITCLPTHTRRTMVEVTKDSCHIKWGQNNIIPPYKNHHSYRNQNKSVLILEATFRLQSPEKIPGYWFKKKNKARTFSILRSYHYQLLSYSVYLQQIWQSNFRICCPLPSTNVALDQFFNTFTNLGPIHLNPCNLKNYRHTLKRLVKNV